MYPYIRTINFEAVLNFRDLGGYWAKDGRMVAWRRLFRSGELHQMTAGDFNLLKEEIGLKTIIDLRSNNEIKSQAANRLSEAGVKYFNIAFLNDDNNRQPVEPRLEEFNDIGNLYLHMIRQKEFGCRLVEALEIIARLDNHPLVFHCFAGKDRTGVLAAMLLSLLGVADEDIIQDFSLSTPYMDLIKERFYKRSQMREDGKVPPDFFWKAEPQSMSRFLTGLKQEFGSAREYVAAHGADTSLCERLEGALLI